MGYFQVLAGVDYGEIFSILLKNVMSMTALFYGFALYEDINSLSVHRNTPRVVRFEFKLLILHPLFLEYTLSYT